MYFEVSEAQIKKEKEAARLLRKSRWWQNLISSQPRCYYCDKLLVAKDVTMDHIVPLSQGGLSVKGNVVASCKPCNSLKKDMTAVEWQLLIEKRRQPIDS